MGGNLLTVQSLTHTHSNDDIFHGSDKMPKHLEMVRTKCQPKIGTDKMPTTIKSPDKMPTFGWHFVRLAFCPHTIVTIGVLITLQRERPRPFHGHHTSSAIDICARFLRLMSTLKICFGIHRVFLYYVQYVFQHHVHCG